MRRRKVVDEMEAEALVGELIRSGEAPADFYRSRGIDGRSLNCWRRNLARGERGVQHPVRLVELAPSWVPAAIYRVVVGDVVLEVDDSFREETLARLIELARAC